MIQEKVTFQFPSHLFDDEKILYEALTGYCSPDKDIILLPEPKHACERALKAMAEVLGYTIELAEYKTFKNPNIWKKLGDRHIDIYEDGCEAYDHKAIEAAFKELDES